MQSTCKVKMYMANMGSCHGQIEISTDYPISHRKNAPFTKPFLDSIN